MAASASSSDKVVGILVGRERSFPDALIAEINGRKAGVVARYAEIEATRIDTRNDHGTGCSLSAAIAANLALGADGPTAISRAKAFVARGLVGGASWTLGAGHGPIDHFGWSASS